VSGYKLFERPSYEKDTGVNWPRSQQCLTVILHFSYSYKLCMCCLQCFETVDWESERAFGL